MTFPESLPEEIVLKPSKSKWAGVLLIGLLFTLAGVYQVQDGDQRGWFVLLFFGAVSVVSLFPLLSTVFYLRLNRYGFEQSLMGRKLTCTWQDVSEFSVWSIKQGFITTSSSVSFSRISDNGKIVSSINQKLTGGTSSLGDNFGMKAKDLAELMNAFRLRALVGS